MKNDRWSYNSVKMWEVMTRCMDTYCSSDPQPASCLLFLMYLQLELVQLGQGYGPLALSHDLSHGQRALIGWDWNLMVDNEAQGGCHRSLSPPHFHFDLKETQVGTHRQKMGLYFHLFFKLFSVMILFLKGLHHVYSKHTSFKLQNRFVLFKINPSLIE